MSVDWNRVDERLIRQGELLLSLDFLEGYDRELRRMNRGKVGRPYVLTERYVEFLSVVRYLFCFPYRQLEGFTRALNRLVPRLPSADYSGLRRRILSLDLSLYESLKLSDSRSSSLWTLRESASIRLGNGLNANTGRRNDTSRSTWPWM